MQISQTAIPLIKYFGVQYSQNKEKQKFFETTMSAPIGMTFVDPEQVIGSLEVVKGDTVADFGCGAGFFSFEFAKRTAPDGTVYALDVLPAALEAVASRAKTLGITNVVTKRVNLEQENGSTLAPQSVNWVILKDMLFQNQKKDIILREVRIILKPVGHALIMEWSPGESFVGPEKSLRHSPDELKGLVEAANLAVEKEIPVGGFHYAFLVKPR